MRKQQMRQCKRIIAYLVLAIMLLFFRASMPRFSERAEITPSVVNQEKLSALKMQIFEEDGLPEKQKTGRLQRSDSEDFQQNGMLESILDFAVVLWIMLLLIVCIRQEEILQLGSSTGTLQQNILYIHQADGKKREAFCSRHHSRL